MKQLLCMRNPIFGLLVLAVANVVHAAGASAQARPCRDWNDLERPIQWIEPERDADRQRLRESCRTIGPPVLVVAKAYDAARMDSLLVISWNIHVGEGDLIDFVARVRSGRWTDGVRVDHFVLLLQEVHRTGSAVPEWAPGFKTPGRIAATQSGPDRVDIVTVAQRLGMELFYAPSMRNGGEKDPREDRGNAILSTLPLTDHAVLELPFEGQRRAAVAATIHGTSTRGQGWSLRICSAHLDARSHGLRVFASLGSARVRQARHLVQHLAAGPTILGGDFNTWTTGPREAAISIIRDAFPLPVRLTDGGTLVRRVLYDPRVDYMFFRLAAQDSVRYRRIDERFESDHHPLIATVPVLHLGD